MIDPGYVIHDGTPHMTFQHPEANINFMWVLVATTVGSWVRQRSALICG
jgi:hypothetical protein